jgi:RNA polymerase sigma-70 factor (ECF subfamily)
VQDEADLLARARRLDPDALAAIHDAYYRPVFRYLAFRVSDASVAEDLASEVFTRLIQALRDRSVPPRSLKGWLYGVAGHVVADYHRHHYRSQEVGLDDTIPDEDANPADSLEAMLTSENLRSAVSLLAPDQQTVIALRYGQGLSIQETAQVMGKNVGAVKQLQARAIAALGRRLGGQAE